MTPDPSTIHHPSTIHPLLRILRRKNVLAGLMFIAIAALGLWVSRNYPIGTALRMSTGYVPRLLCWLLMGLGAVVLLQGLREADASTAARGRPTVDAPAEPAPLARLRPVAMVTLGLIAFALSLEPLGLVLGIFLLAIIASLATSELKLWETLAAAAALSVLSWAIFVASLGLPIPMWPDW